jgi:hypothetical protein
MVDQSVIDAFQMMWGKFPEGVMLVDKGRNIVSVKTTASINPHHMMS